MVLELKNISADELINIQNTSKSHEKIILRFTADWCGPCKKIEPIVNEFKDRFNDNTTLITIDIDETIDIYQYMKRYKCLNGIPAILVFNGGKRDNWYIADNCVLGSKTDEVKQLFTLLSN